MNDNRKLLLALLLLSVTTCFLLSNNDEGFLLWKNDDGHIRNLGIRRRRKLPPFRVPSFRPIRPTPRVRPFERPFERPKTGKWGKPRNYYDTNFGKPWKDVRPWDEQPYTFGVDPLVAEKKMDFGLGDVLAEKQKESSTLEGNNNKENNGQSFRPPPQEESFFFYKAHLSHRDFLIEDYIADEDQDYLHSAQEDEKGIELKQQPTIHRPDFLYSKALGPRMVLYYEVESPRSKPLLDNYAWFAASLSRLAQEKGQHIRIRYNAISCTAYPDLCHDRNITAVPTFELLQSGSTTVASPAQGADIVLYLQYLDACKDEVECLSVCLYLLGQKLDCPTHGIDDAYKALFPTAAASNETNATTARNDTTPSHAPTPSPTPRFSTQMPTNNVDGEQESTSAPPTPPHQNSEQEADSSIQVKSVYHPRSPIIMFEILLLFSMAFWFLCRAWRRRPSFSNNRTNKPQLKHDEEELETLKDHMEGTDSTAEEEEEDGDVELFPLTNAVEM